MDSKDILRELRSKAGLSQDELAAKVYVTRQAVSRWETGETIPGTETLKLLSRLFDVSINTLLGSPRKLICQCCGMPLEDSCISRETDGVFNEEYCKWCYADGRYAYSHADDLIDFCAAHMASGEFPAAQVRTYMSGLLPKLNHWKRYAALAGTERLDEFKRRLIDEFNALHIDGMPAADELHLIPGRQVNFEYMLPGGRAVRFLEDNALYLGNRLECLYGGDRGFGLVAGMGFLLVYTCDQDGSSPELVMYKMR